MILAILSVMPFMVCLFWCVMFLVEYRTLTKAQRVLFSFMGVCTVLYFCHGVFFMNHGEQIPVSDTVYSFCNIAVYPVFYLYIRRLTVAGKLPLRCLLDLLPALVICAWTAVIYIIGGPDVLQRQEVRMTVGRIVFVIQILFVSYFGAKRLRQFDKSLEEFYSNKENRELSLFGILTLVMLACALASTVVSSVGRDYFSENETMLALPSCIFSVVLFTIAYVGYKQTFDADALEEDMKEHEDIVCTPTSRESMSKSTIKVSGSEKRYPSLSAIGIESDSDERLVEAGPKADYEDEDNGGDQEQAFERAHQLSTSQGEDADNELLEDSSLLRERLMELLDKDNVYLDSNLKLTDVASRLHIGRSTLSAFINQHLGVSFSDFINQKRIDHAKGLIKSEPTLTLIEVSEKSGFASPSSFYRAFKKYVGVTPKDWVAKGN